MSTKNKAPNSKDAARQYVEWLSKLGCFTSIMIGGSRSPLREKQPHKDSDWDLVGVTQIEKLKLFSPRSTNVLHADLLIVNPSHVDYLHKTVEIWPTDIYKVLK